LLFDKNPYLFQGRRLDEETGLYYFRNRYYDPAHGRFILRDPEGFVDGPNLYSFVNNNPVCYVDPYGLYYGGASLAEIWWAIWHPVEAAKAQQCAGKALQEAGKRYPDSLVDGKGDAFRHAYWNYLMTKELGESLAKEIADRHEGDSKSLASQMDRFNNQEGREIAGESSEGAEAIADAVKEGRLRIIVTENGEEKMVPSNYGEEDEEDACPDDK